MIDDAVLITVNNADSRNGCKLNNSTQLIAVSGELICKTAHFGDYGETNRDDPKARQRRHMDVRRVSAFSLQGEKWSLESLDWGKNKRKRLKYGTRLFVTQKQLILSYTGTQRDSY